MYGTSPHPAIPPAPKQHGDIVARKLTVPTVPTRTYSPRSINLSLTPAEALVLAELAEGYRRIGKIIRHPADALKHLLDHIGDADSIVR